MEFLRWQVDTCAPPARCGRSPGAPMPARSRWLTPSPPRAPSGCSPSSPARLTPSWPRRSGPKGRILVTLDRGFADLRAYPPGSHPGIVVLRQGLTSVTAALKLLAGYEGLAEIGGCTVIVSDASVRVRRAVEP